MQNPDFKLHLSKFYCLFLGTLLLGSALVIILLPLPYWLRVLLLAALLIYGSLIFRQYALLRGSFSVIRLKKMEEKRWQVITPSRVFECALRGDSVVTTVVSVLRFNIPGKHLPLVSVVFRDSLRAEDYRRLVAALRMDS
jgi:hypothetical protein